MVSDPHVAVGSYCLNALEQSELKEFEEHLRNCASCSREVLEFSETVQRMSALTVGPSPPPGLRDSVLSAINQIRVVVDVVADGERPLVDTKVIALRQQRRFSRVLALAVAAALVVAFGLGNWVAALTSREAPVAGSTLEVQLLAAPDLRGYTVPLKNGGEVTLIVSKSYDRALLSGIDLPALAPDKTYQVWTLRKTSAIPNVLLGNTEPASRWLSGHVGSSTAVAISIEPIGGSTRPTIANILAVQPI